MRPTAVNLLLLVALLMLVAICASAQVPGPIHISAPCTQTLDTAVGAYSGSLAITAHQYGFMSVNVVTGSQGDIQFKNGTWRAQLGGCSGRSDLVWDQGDCHQSVVRLTASNGTPKWLVTPGAPNLCASALHPFPVGMSGLTVWKWNGTKFDIIGLIQHPSGVAHVDRLSTPVLDHDIAWTKINASSPNWVSCDLNAMTCDWTHPIAAPPPGEGRQSGVGGFAYNVNVDYSCPPVDGGPRCFLLTRSDQPTPTRPPAPTATRTVSSPPRTATITPTYSPCPPFCPPTSTPTITGTRRPTATPARSVTPTPGTSRFSISVTWTKPDGTSGIGTGVCGSEGSSGDYSSGFWFFSQSNTELFVSVLPSACAINGKVWVKVFGGTNVQVDISITDHLTGSTWNYHNGQGQLFQTQIDTGAMPCGGTP